MTPTSFDPPHRILMGPGPSDVHPRVLAAMGRPTIGHLDPRFVAMMDELKRLLQFAFRTVNPLTIPISGPGSAGAVRAGGRRRLSRVAEDTGEAPAAFG